MKIYLNGNFISDQDVKIEHNDRGFLLSDGIFETMRAYDGSVFCLEAHYERLTKSAKFLEISFTITLQEFKRIINNLLKANELNDKNASLRVTLTRGTGPRGLIPPENVNPTLMATAFPFTPSTPKPSKVIISQIRRNEFSPLSNIKSLCYLDNILARSDANKKGVDECILLNTIGNVACASVANVFLVTENGVITPRLQEGALPGITRKVIMDLCKANNIPVFEQAITEVDLMKAKEVFFTNRLIEIQPVVEVNSKLINGGKVGEVVLLLQKLYKNKIINSFEKNEKIPFA